MAKSIIPESKTKAFVAEQRWIMEVLQKSDVVDPNNRHDWESLAIGFFIGCGLSPGDAYLLAQKVKR